MAKYTKEQCRKSVLRRSFNNKRKVRNAEHRKTQRERRYARCAYINEHDRFFVGLRHRVGSLLLESINGTNARHDPIAHIHKHTTGKQKSTNRQQCHYTNQMQHNGMKGTVLISAKEVVPTKQCQSKGCAGPCVDQKQQEVLQIGCSHTIVHPRTVMVHP